MGPSAAAQAIFLSYASQDTQAARLICDTLRSEGLEVWFDRSELRGGDAWDASIRRQIKECALFVPVISANTQSRTEGYFRLEWRLAEQRSHLMAKGRPFLVPVVIDATPDAGAHVPDAFLEVQWSRLPGGQCDAAFAARMRQLISGEIPSRSAGKASSSQAPAASLKGASRWRTWIVAAALLVPAGGLVVALAPSVVKLAGRPADRECRHRVPAGSGLHGRARGQGARAPRRRSPALAPQRRARGAARPRGHREGPVERGSLRGGGVGQLPVPPVELRGHAPGGGPT